MPCSMVFLKMLYSKASTAFDWIENANTAEILIIFAANSFNVYSEIY